MKTIPHLVVITALSGAAAIAGAAAQTSEPELDLAAIRARAKVEASEADALAATARARAQAVVEQADKTAAAAEVHGKRYTDAAGTTAKRQTSDIFDFDTMVADAGTMAKGTLGEAPRFIAFASLSMPPSALRAMVDDVTRAGGVVVFRGLPGNSARALATALSKIARAGEQMDGVGIDPRLFRAFGIEAVPSYVVASSDFELCDGFDCRTPLPPHDRMSGNVSVSYALETFAQGGGPGALIASQHLARLTRSEP